METSSHNSPRVQLALPIRVRGMSIHNKFFDEATETILVSEHGFMSRLQNLVELDTQVHVVCLKNNVAATFRVVWVNTRSKNGFHQVGFEVLESEGDMWGIHFPPFAPPTDVPAAQVW